MRYDGIGSSADLENLVKVGSMILDSTPLNIPARPERLSEFGEVCHAYRFDQTGSVENIDRAIETLTAGMKIIHRDHRNRIKWSCLLTELFAQRFEQLGNTVDLDTAVELAERTLGSIPVSHGERTRLVYTVAESLVLRYDRVGAIEDLDQAIELVGTVIPHDTVSRLANLAQLGGLLGERFSRTKKKSDINKAIEALHTANEMAQDAELFRRIGICLMKRFQEYGKAQDLQDAITAGKKAMSLGHDALTNLGLIIS
ncbi:hypothetical protein TWF694_009373 [Orbilia ellipsospora]|uniref:MalT-like TPR region domain-containing protein n=1 Tax=Orbilia ellipsospora TaxID=2528407 RepID=A0AAV9XHF7_9PEZI